MISGAFSVLFGLFSILIGGVFICYGWTEWLWLALAFGLLFVWFGYVTARDGLVWLRMRPARALQLFEDHFCIGSDRYSYKEFKSLGVRRIRTKKTLNFVPSGVDETVIAHLHLDRGTICLRAGSSPSKFFGPDIGQSESKKFLETLQLLKWRAEN